MICRFLAIFKKNIFIGTLACIFAFESDLHLQRTRQRKSWTGQNPRMEWLWRDFLRLVVRPFVLEIQRGLQRVSVDFASSRLRARISFTLYKRTEALWDTAWNYPCIPWARPGKRARIGADAPFRPGNASNIWVRILVFPKILTNVLEDFHSLFRFWAFIFFHILSHFQKIFMKFVS